ncbi:cell surface protein [Bifidobacterium leontopitheci]|uniref:Cell surface protein n=2 Tax=Bifidobacterium leontopitheci TaxID=2650774 RepID=A0A6I1GLU5_9BIFI|nr:cell surface protein [Bifidobacterium leontopitheci]
MAPRRNTRTAGAAASLPRRLRDGVASAIAVAMMFATAVVGAATAPLASGNTTMNRTAQAAAGICVPTTHDLGDSTAVGSMNDTGVATYVGRNFFVGTPTTDSGKLNGDPAPGPTGRTLPKSKA